MVFVPDVAEAGAVFKMLRSAMRWAVVMAVAKLLVALVSSVGLVAVTVGVLVIGPVAVGLMCTVMVKGWVALGAIVFKVPVTAPAFSLPPPVAQPNPSCAGRTSVTVPPLEVEGPLFV